MQQAVSYNNTILLKKDLHFSVRWSRVGRIPGWDCLCQMSGDSSPERIKGLAKPSDRSYLFSLWSHQLSLYQFLSNCFFTLTHPLFHQWFCACSGSARSGKVPFLPSPSAEADRIKPSCMYCVFRSGQRTWKLQCDHFPFGCGVSSSQCDLPEQRAQGSSFMLLLMHDNQVPRS